MILADTFVWVDHLRLGEDGPFSILPVSARLLCHPFVVGELAMGSIRDRDRTLDELRRLPMCSVADHDEVLAFVSRQHLFALGIGYVDAHLLAVTSLPNTRLWTLDKRLRAAAETLGVAFLNNKSG